MLVEFSIANYRSILERQTFGLTASSDAEHASRNLMTSPGEELSLLRSLAIYGPNASGKSNLLRGLASLKQLIEESATKVQEGQPLAVSPFILSSKSINEPSEFEIVFIAEDGVRYHYHCAVSAERVHREWMVASPNGRPQRWFERTYDSQSNSYEWWFGPNFKGERAERKIWQDFTRSNALFFSTAIQLNNDQLKPAFAWITQKLIVLTANTGWNGSLSLELLRQERGQAKLMSYMRAADIGIDRLELIEGDNTFPPSPSDPAGVARKALEDALPPWLRRKRAQVRAWHKQVDTKEPVSLDMRDESDGTRKLFEFAGGWIRALESGATLFVDELDRSLHPHMTRFLVELFHGSTNREGAQLIYTTHDTTLLNTDLLRRDQVWFIEKDENQATQVYSLLEYRPRKDEALERGYLKGRYGALPLIGNLST